MRALAECYVKDLVRDRGAVQPVPQAIEMDLRRLHDQCKRDTALFEVAVEVYSERAKMAGGGIETITKDMIKRVTVKIIEER
jgi:hypothetical protein